MRKMKEIQPGNKLAFEHFLVKRWNFNKGVKNHSAKPYTSLLPNRQGQKVASLTI